MTCTPELVGFWPSPPSIRLDPTLYPFLVCHFVITLENILDFHVQKINPDSCYALVILYTAVKRASNHFQGGQLCSCDFVFFQTRGRLKRRRLFFMIGSEMDMVWLTSRSLTLVSYCSSPIFSFWCTVLITAGSARSLLTNARTGFPFPLWCWLDFSHLVQMPFAHVWPHDVVNPTHFFA